jgi:very-short-patch-repair endonuclease
VIGPYIGDFFCASVKLVIELDGSQHFEDVGKLKDLERDKYLDSLGITVKRYSNNEINEDFEAVCSDVYQFLFPEES